ncbi:hypothetical protein [Cysteiniphilum sp. QT6929]|uniref:hypothetical protein n=1 Tax=Cysteiniphilum sp. QT6929 TaxID=2975055 RepID=UPI0024B3744E|nr:hypothetical protein [Cysteiniphilum sp. QT6929]WHN65177.1 hypothetical protein NYP54_09020 [Cysteiniphilum sp. QT6929]
MSTRQKAAGSLVLLFSVVYSIHGHSVTVKAHPTCPPGYHHDCSGAWTGDAYQCVPNEEYSGNGPYGSARFKLGYIATDFTEGNDANLNFSADVYDTYIVDPVVRVNMNVPVGQYHTETGNYGPYSIYVNGKIEVTASTSSGYDNWYYRKAVVEFNGQGASNDWILSEDTLCARDELISYKGWVLKSSTGEHGCKLIDIPDEAIVTIYFRSKNPHGCVESDFQPYEECYNR